ncbi:hypothetical protein POL68_40825 [Stigmatella sp. ncwal1]|uniref:Dolichyl-phosphate-mannose-protein mannosyltransferase n=1 Tax=Stigmatella ashevillensis TaxID=2995309 RepID=A0ABT5DP78_9BACT|nr:hypothetical protein [Stigmatella ashevillena]MDC0714864.1 hypothetical protein [Stigmatella ashevillena]
MSQEGRAGKRKKLLKGAGLVGVWAGHFALAAALRWNWLRADLEPLVAGVIPDDAFYYFQIARQVWAGHGVTFDGIAPATGLHFLWLLLLLPLFAFSPVGDPQAVSLALWMSTGLIALASVSVTLIARAWTQSWLLAFVLGACLGANPWVVRESLNGLETALSLACLGMSLLALVRYLEVPSQQRAWKLTGLLILTLLARSDALVVLAPACMVLLIHRTGWPDAVRVAGGTAAGVVLLSLTHWLRTGSFLQSSATAVPWLFHANWNRLHPGASAEQVHQHSLEVFMEALRLTQDLLGQPQTGLFWLCLVLSVGVLLLQACRQRLADPQGARAMAIILGLTGGLVGLQFIHGYMRWLPRPWYFVSASLVACLAPAALFRLCLPTAAPRWQHLCLGALFLTAGGFTLFQDVSQTLATRQTLAYPWQAEMLQGGRHIAQTVPPGAVVGAFNSGILGYVSEYTVVNLDGVVNEDAARALKRGELLAYMHDRKVRYLLDYPVMWRDSPFIHCTWPYWGARATRPRELQQLDIPGIGWPNAGEALILAEVPGPQTP